MGQGLESACLITKFVVVFGATSWIFATSTPCSELDGSVYVNGKCLKFFDIRMTWSEAQDLCSTHLHGGTLAEPVTPEERNVTVNLAMSLQQTFWLGAAYVAAAGTFKFTQSKVSLPANDTWWASGEPTLNGVADNCLLVGVDLLTVVDRSCATLERPLCQIEVTPKEPPIDPCAPWKGATYKNGKCFKTFNISRSWQDAQKFCPAAISGAKLVEFLTEEERRNVMSYGSDGGLQKTWIGGADVSHNRTFVWFTNQNVAIERNIFNNFEPNDAMLGEDCLCQLAASGLFNDAGCEQLMPFLCETALTSACDLAVSLSINQKCIKLINVDTTWDSAQKVCQTAGGTLAEPTDNAERTAIAKKFPYKFYWVGATDSAIEESFVWTNHQTVVRLNWWQDGQPGSLNEFCVAFDSRVGTLSDEDCNNALPFICQFDAASPCEGILPGSVYASGYCFKYYSQQVTWSEARSYCLHNNSHLAEPKTAEMERVVQLHLGPLNAAWLGANNAMTKENFTWVTGGDQAVSTYLSSSDISGQDNYLLWNNTAGGVLWQDRPGTEKHGFLCQTAVVVVDPQRHVAVLPKMVRNGSPEAHLQITAGFRSIEVYLTFKVSYDKGVEEEKLMTLTPKRAVQFNLNTSLTVTDTDVYSRFVEVTSSMPVVVVLYVMDRTLNMASSCLIFPAQMFASKQTGRSYILHSGIPYRKDTTVTIVAMSGGTTDVMITYNNHGTPASSFSIGGVIVNKLYTARATLKYMNDAMTVSIGANLDGAYVNASQPVAVFLENLGNKSSTSVYDFSMDQLLPLEYIEEEYIGFLQNPIASRDYYRFVAAEDWTFVEIRYMNQSTKSTILKGVGDVTVLDATQNAFYQIRGNASFYAYEIFDRMGKSGCMSSLLPASAWRYQYDFEINSAYKGYNVNLLVIVWSNMSSYVEINYNLTKYPQLLKGTPYTGVLYTVPGTDRYYHVQLTNQRAKFGAYLFAYGSSASFCHPLGIAAKQGTASSIPSYDKYQASLLQEDVPQTTCAVEGTTSETAYETTETRESAASASGPTTDAPYFPTSDVHATEEEATYAGTTQGENQHSDVTTASSGLKTTTWSTTGQDVEKLTGDIHRHLYIDERNTSAYRRTMTSAPDYRFSARMIGGVGVAVLASVFTIISLGDSSHVYELYKFLGGKSAVS